MERNISPRIIVQGGGFSQMLGKVTADEYKRVTKESAKRGYEILMNGGTAVEAVEAAVRVFEDSPCFNAGHGSYLNCEGEVECDAMIMEGHTLNNGAVICGRNFLNPVSLCVKIMYESPHCALSGSGALKFAQDNNFPICDPKDLISPFLDGIPPTYDTVSAVAMDTNGHLACATSTGGIARKLRGRVGDAPLIGCGAYANETGGATVTGIGESIMKMTLGREVVYNMENGKNAQESAEYALTKMRDTCTVDGLGGVIAIDKNGKFGKAFNTEMMVWASIEDNTLEFGLEQNEAVQTEIE